MRRRLFLSRSLEADWGEGLPHPTPRFTDSYPKFSFSSPRQSPRKELSTRDATLAHIMSKRCPPLLADQPQRLSHSVCFLQHVNVGEPNDADPLCLQRSRPLVVSYPTPRAGMSTAVHFNRQAQLMAIEVQHIGIDRMLSAESDAELPPSNQLPNRAFGVGLPSPKGACQLQQPGRGLLERPVGMR